nr:nitroreductase family protein [uncultured Lachnoclostridium sp.]
MNKAWFQVDKDKCTGCGLCARVCPGGVLSLDGEEKIRMADFEGFGWNGCWKCEHCLAVCPAGAVSIFGRRPANAPNGGNKQQVEFTLIDDRKQMERLRTLAFREMEALAKEGVYPEGFDRASYEDMKRWRKTVRPDMLFCGAPHLLIPHAPLGKGEPVQDVLVAGTYFELLCASRGLGAVMLTFPLGALKRMPRIRAMLEMPEDHYTGMFIGFGYPEISYKRGVQKTVDPGRIHRPAF